jgi:hypothetical protein
LARPHRPTSRAGQFTEVSYDEADIVDWQPVHGHAGVIALTLASYSEGSEIDADGSPDNLRP